mgnify:CR=1 FL=1
MKKQVLFVEDDTFITQMYMMKLDELDLDVHVYGNPVEAKEFLEQTDIEFDLFLFDLLLPDMNGYELLDWVKKEEYLKHVPVIILSNLSAQKDINEAYEAGAADYIVKSNFTPNEVMRVIKKHLHI